MKTKFQLPLACAALLATAGCVTTGLSPAERAGVTYPNYILNLQPCHANSVHPKLAPPLRLAVAQVGESTPPQSFLDKLEKEPFIVKSAVGLPAPGDDLGVIPRKQGSDEWNNYSAKIEALCQLARSVGADYIFIFGGNIDSWHDGNALKFLDFTIVGGAIVPSTKIHIEARAAGALLDAATCEPVLLVSAETNSSSASPTFLADGRTDTLKSRLSGDLGKKLADALLQKISSYEQTASSR